MANVKVVVSVPKTRRAFQKEVDIAPFLGKLLREKIDGDSVGLAGYELELTGGSDKQGFPMRGDVSGTARKRALLSGGVGFHSERKGQRKRKSVRGNTVSEDIAQLNLKVVKEGAKSVPELWSVELKPTKTETKAAEKKAKAAEAKAEKKEEKAEAKAAEKAAEAPKAEAKPVEAAAPAA